MSSILSDFTYIRAHRSHCLAAMSNDQWTEFETTFEEEQDEYNGGDPLAQAFPRSAALVKAFLASEGAAQ